MRLAMTSSLRAVCRRRWRGFVGAEGSVALELALLMPFLLVLFYGLVDFGYYFTSSQGIASATRIGAEYARDSTTCKTQIQPPFNSQVSATSNCGKGIVNAMQNSMDFSPKLTYPANFGLSCYCDRDANGNPATSPPSIACSSSCSTIGEGANLVFITVSAHQRFSPIIASPGFAWLPTSVAALTEMRIQ
jgi:hypothetical protein